MTECEESGTNRLALRRSELPQRARPPARRGPVGGPRAIDALDQRIIEALQANGRESFRQIAARVGVSEATIRARYTRLCSEEILQVVAVTNPHSAKHNPDDHTCNPSAARTTAVSTAVTVGQKN